MVAPVSPAALIISTTMPDGPAALPDFIFEMAFFNMSIVIGIGGPSNGRQVTRVPVKFNDEKPFIMFSPRILLCLLAHWHFPSVILHWLVPCNINMNSFSSSGWQGGRYQMTCGQCPHRPPCLYCGLHGAPHVWSEDALCSVMWCSCAFASLPWCFECLGVMASSVLPYAPPSFTY